MALRLGASLALAGCGDAGTMGPEPARPPANRPPSVALVPDAARKLPDSTFVITAVATDPDGDALRHAWTVNGTRWGGASGSITVRPPVLGPVTVGVTVTDAGGATASATTVVRTLFPDRWVHVDRRSDICALLGGFEVLRLAGVTGPFADRREDVFNGLVLRDSLGVALPSEAVSWHVATPALLSLAPVSAGTDVRVITGHAVGTGWVVGTAGEVRDSLAVRIVPDVLRDCGEITISF